MGWLFILIAGLLEVGFTTFLKLSGNFSKLWPSIAFILFAIMSFTFLSLSLKYFALGTAYAIWTGIGAFGTALIGILFFGESTDFWRLIFLFLLITSIIGLKIVSPNR